jgi:hypothetical protein
VRPTIRINGRDYDDPESMPPEVRRLYDDAMRQAGDAFADRDGNGIPDVVESAGLGPPRTVVEQRIVVNGRSYDRVEDVPADVREFVESVTGNLPGLGAPGARMGSAPRAQGGLDVSFSLSRNEIGSPDAGAPRRLLDLSGSSSVQSGFRLLLIALAILAGLVVVLMGALVVSSAR